MSTDFDCAILAQRGPLRAFCARLAGATQADDLSQETLARALKYRHTFVDGTDMQAWLRRIARNCFYRAFKPEAGRVDDADGVFAARHAVAPSQDWRMAFSDMLSSLDRLSPETRGALLMVVVSGFTYEEAALAAECPVGTLKSRVNRAREHLSSEGLNAGEASHAQASPRLVMDAAE